MQLSLSLAQEYLRLYKSCNTDLLYSRQIADTLNFIANFKDRIKAIGLKIPWHIAAIVLVHDANVKLLDWQWEPALENIIEGSLLGDWTDWSLAGSLYALEGFYTNWIYQLRGKLPPDLWSGTDIRLIGTFVNGRWNESMLPKPILGVVPLLKAIYESDLIPDVCQPNCDALLLGQGFTGMIKVKRMGYLVRNKNLSPEEQFTSHPVGTGNSFLVGVWRLETNQSGEFFVYFQADKPIAGFTEWYAKYSDIFLI